MSTFHIQHPCYIIIVLNRFQFVKICDSVQYFGEYYVGKYHKPGFLWNWSIHNSRFRRICPSLRRAHRHGVKKLRSIVLGKRRLSFYLRPDRQTWPLLSFKQRSQSSEGASIYDVRTRGGRGLEKADVVREVSKGGCVKMRTRGEG